MEIKVWVGNLGKYNEGELAGEWFTLPADLNEIAETIGLNEQYEEYHLCDWEAPDGIEINRFSDLEKLNDIAEILNDLDDYDQKMLGMILKTGDFNLNEAIDILGDGSYSVYTACKDMSDVAYSFYEESGMLAEIEKVINPDYIDWERIGRDMEINGNFYKIDYDTYIEID